MNKYFIWVSFLPSNVVNNIATLGKIGHFGRIPGTNGSAVGLLLYTAFFYPLSFSAFLILEALLIYLAIAFCDEAEKRMMKHDPKVIILDEFIAVPICFVGLRQYFASGSMWLFMILGFFIFRFFDVLKPLGISKLQNLPGGLGVVVDDLAAAAATCIVLHIICLLIYYN